MLFYPGLAHPGTCLHIHQNSKDHCLDNLRMKKLCQDITGEKSRRMDSIAVSQYLLLFLLSLTITESEANSNKNPMMRRAGLSHEERKGESHQCPSVPGSSSLKVELLGRLLLPVKVQGKTRILLPPHLLLLQTKKFNCFMCLFRALVQIKLIF